MEIEPRKQLAFRFTQKFHSNNPSKVNLCLTYTTQFEQNQGRKGVKI
nr:MAG TPA: hypothetical protein [Caudoviricetes sp.]